MILRKIVFFTLLSLPLIGGGWPRVGNDSAIAAEKRSAVVPHQPTDSSQTTPKTFDWLSHLSRQIHAYATAIQHNKELLLYAAIAGFGMLMVVLAISNARSTPKDTATQIMDILRQEKEKAEHLAN